MFLLDDDSMPFAQMLKNTVANSVIEGKWSEQSTLNKQKKLEMYNMFTDDLVKKLNTNEIKH